MSISTTPTKNVYGTMVNGRMLRPRKSKTAEKPQRNMNEDIVPAFDEMKERELKHLGEMVSMADNYRYGDAESLDMICRVAKLYLGYEVSTRINPRLDDAVAKTVLCGKIKNIRDRGMKAKSKLEVCKLLNEISKPDGEKTVKTYLQGKSEKDRFEIAKELLRYFKAPLNPQNMDFQGCLDEYRQRVTDGRVEVCNKVLQTLGYQVVKVENVKTPVEVQQVVRAAFDGRLNLPTPEDNEAGTGYSPTYQKFINGSISASNDLPQDYNFATTKLGKAMALSENMKIMIPDIRKAVQDANLPQEVAANLSLSDVAHLMLNARGLERQDCIKFQQITPRCSNGAREEFWENFGKDAGKLKMLKDTLSEYGVDAEYIRDLLTNIKVIGQPCVEQDKEYKQPIPEISIHHGFYIQDAAAQKNPLMVDDPANYEICIDFPSQGINTHKQNNNENGFKHMADVNSVDGKSTYRLVTYPEEKGRTTLISVGTRQISAEISGKENLMTYVQMAERKSYS